MSEFFQEHSSNLIVVFVFAMAVLYVFRSMRAKAKGKGCCGGGCSKPSSPSAPSCNCSEGKNNQ